MARIEACDGEVGRRREALADALREARVDAAVVATEPNFTYLSGYATPSWAMRARPLMLVVTAAGDGTAVISDAEAERLREIVPGIAVAPFSEPVAVPIGGEPVLDFVAAAVHRLVDVLTHGRPARVAIERAAPFGPGLTEAAVNALSARLGVELVDIAPLLWPLRRQKSNAELNCLRAAASILDNAYLRFGARVGPGMTERELYAELATAAAGEGADRLGYGVIVGGAMRPLLGPPGDRAWDAGDVLMVDAGVVRDGYWADYSRHFAAVEPPAATRVAYARIVDALAAGRAACLPGASAADVAAAITGELPRHRDGAFGRVGHGVGLDLTEPPSLHRGERVELLPGMTLCLEPVAAFDGVGRLVGEEMVAVTEQGCELLSPPFPAELEVIA